MASRYGDLNINFLNVLNNKDVTQLNNNIFKSALTVEGGGVIKKGLKIGYQENMVSGLLIYDNENFFGYSDKYGLTPLSKHNDYTQLEIDNYGLDASDHRYLRFIAENYRGGPVGVETISSAISEEKDTVEDSIEPYLIQQGFIEKTPRGRVITEKTWNIFKNL
jgi:hypothetical protein